MAASAYTQQHHQDSKGAGPALTLLLRPPLLLQVLEAAPTRFLHRQSSKYIAASFCIITTLIGYMKLLLSNPEYGGSRGCPPLSFSC